MTPRAVEGEIASLICDFYLFDRAYKCPSRWVPEIHLDNKQGNKQRDVLLRWPAGAVFAGRDLLVGLVVKASALRAEDPGFEFRLRRDFFGVESYQ